MISDDKRPLTGLALWMCAFILALSDFISLLDTTIANVSINSIAGSLGVTNTQGTWVITSYSVAEAITVPLTGWLAARFGPVRVFLICMISFAVTSALCGFASSLEFLVFARVLQGLSGGPLMPMSQALLVAIFPKDKLDKAIAIWAITTLIAPILGTVLGGILCEHLSWPWIFFINIPVIVLCVWLAFILLRRYEQPVKKAKVDSMGMFLLVFWVSSFQIMLDKGKELEWFSSPFIMTLAICAFIGFVLFVIWERGEEHPAVNLRVFRHRGYLAAVCTISMTFAAFFASNVITPMWLQANMGYTSTMAGLATSGGGAGALLVAPLAAAVAVKFDPRKVISIAIFFLGCIMAWRSFANTDMTFWHVLIPLFIMGLFLPFFFIPITSLALGSVDDEETADAAGIMNFVRTLSGAFAASIVTTLWEDWATMKRDAIVNLLPKNPGVDPLILDQLVNAQTAVLSFNLVMMTLAIVMWVSSVIVWAGPKPRFTPGQLPH